MQERNTHEHPEQGARARFFDETAIHGILIILLGLLAYSNTFNASFVFDDKPSITLNPVIQSLDNFFLNTDGYQYNPRRFIGYLTFALNYRFGGMDATGYHIFNLTVHLINALLVYLLVLLTFQTPRLKDSSLSPSSRTVALIAALLFTVHPIQTQAVTFIVQRLASLATLFYLATVALYARARLCQEEEYPGKGKTLSMYFLSLVTAVLAMRTKEIAFTLPVMVLLYEFSFFRTSFRKKLLILAPILLTLLIIPLSLLNVNRPLGEILSDVTEVSRETSLSRWDYLVTQFTVVARYVRLLFLPVNQNADYDYPVYHSLFAPRVFLSFLLLSALLALAVYLFRRSGPAVPDQKANSSPVPGPESRLIAFGILWFFIALSVESSVIPISDVIFEHRVYLPSVGAFIAFAAACVALSRRYMKEIPVVALALVILVLSAATYRRNMIWRNDLTFWSDVVKKSPAKFRGYNNLGAALSRAGRGDEAMAMFAQAIRLKPDSANAYHNLGREYLLQGRFDDAIAELKRAIGLKPDYRDAHINLAIAYNRTGRFEETVRLLEGGMPNLNHRPATHYHLALAYQALGKAEAAAKETEEVRKRDPFLAAELNVLIGQRPPVTKNVTLH